MQDLSRFAFALELKGLAAAALALLLLTLLHAGWRTASGALERRAWIAHPATVVDGSGAEAVELEVAAAVASGIPGVELTSEGIAYEPDHVRIRVAWEPKTPRPDYYFEPLLLQDPLNPARIALYNPWWPWAKVAVQALAALVVALTLAWLLRAGWGTDLSWANGAWVSSDELGTPPGARAGGGELLREPDGNAGVAWIFAGIFGAVMLAAWWQMPSPTPWYAALPFVLLGWLGVASAYQGVALQTRVVAFDESGMLERTAFSVRRAPWSAIASVERRNTSAEAQKRYDNTTPTRRKGKRPESTFAFVFTDAAGSTLFEIGERMQPEATLDALVARAARDERSRERALDKERHDHVHGWASADGEDAKPLTEAEFDAELARSRAEFEAFSKKADQTMRRGWLLVISPFLAICLWLSWRGLWFTFLAERTEGRVVAVEGSELRSLEIEYRDSSGETHRLTTDGSRGLLKYDVGDRIRVFYDEGKPDDARPDLFWEIWLWPIVWGVLSGLVAIPLLLMSL